MCILSERYLFVDYGDLGVVIFEKCDGFLVEFKCLLGFGVFFGVLNILYKFFVLVLLLEVVFKKLFKEVLVKCSLKLVLDFYEWEVILLVW